MKTFLLGAHVSASGGSWKCFENATKLGANAIQIFGASPRSWTARLPDDATCERFASAWKASDVETVFLHGAYLANLASPDEALRKKSVVNLSAHLAIAERLHATGLIFHIGSGKEIPKKDAIVQVADEIKQVLKNVPGKSLLIMENSAGGGQKLGAVPEELGAIMKRVRSKRLKVCIDTAHAFESGLIETFTPEEIKQFLKSWDEHVGLENIVALHANDSKTEFNSKHDRHENIGKGFIGTVAFQNLAKEKKLHDKSWLLEVPGYDNQGPDKKNLDILKSMFQK